MDVFLCITHNWALVKYGARMSIPDATFTGTTTAEKLEGTTCGVDVNSFPFLHPPFSLSFHYFPHCYRTNSLPTHYIQKLTLWAQSTNEQLEQLWSYISSPVKNDTKLYGTKYTCSPGSAKLERMCPICPIGWFHLRLHYPTPTVSQHNMVSGWELQKQRSVLP